jgi:hypothetical protein
MPEHKHKEYELAVYLYDTREEMIEDNKRLKGSFGLFVLASQNSSYIGSVKLAKDALTIDTIVHECCHAAIETCYHMGKCFSKRYEETIVGITGLYSKALIEKLKDRIIWD